MSTNPLQKYFRQPKLFISLPSKGLYYFENSLQGDSSNMPVFAMTGMDEIIMKTPDALFNGEATTKVIESCCPYIKDAKAVPSLDIDTLLVAIRIATFGEKMTIEHTCGNCGTENDFDVDLKSVIDHYSSLSFENEVDLGEIIIQIKPLTYQELTEFNIENFKLQRMLFQLNDTEMPDAEKRKLVDDIYARLAQIQLDLIVSSIESVRVPEAIVSEKEYVKEWLANMDAADYDKIKEKLERNRDTWNMPKQPVQCTECGTQDQISFTLDQANFFVRG